MAPLSPSSVLTTLVTIIFVGDQHLSDVAPATRTDDYTQAIFDKLEFIFAYAVAHKIPFIVLLGDLFHRKRPSLNSHQLVTRLIALIKLYKARYRDTHGQDLVIFTLVGNHDIHFTISNLNRQPITVLDEAGAVKILNRQPVPLVPGIELNAAPYGTDTETDPAAYHLTHLEEHSFKIWCFHSTLIPDGDSFYGHWVNFHQVADIKADVVVCGHFHPGYQPQRAHGKLWFNPGAISRGTAEEHNITRPIQFAVLTVDNQRVPQVKMIPVPHAPAEKVFNLDKVKAERHKRSDIEGFVEAIRSNVVENDDVTTVEKLKSSLLTMSDDAEVVALASHYIDDAADEQGLQ